MQWEGTTNHRLRPRTEQYAVQAAESIEKWGFAANVHRHTGCVTLLNCETNERLFEWHPVRKQFRVAGTDEWFTPGRGIGIVKIMVNLRKKDLLPEEIIPGLAEYLNKARESI